MRLTLIHPCIGRRADEAYMKTWQMEPLPAAMIAALTPKSVDIEFYDDRLEEIPYDNPTDVVAISIETYTAKRSYQIASEYRRRGIPVIMGGFHASLCPDEVGRYADSVVTGEIEELWKTIIDDAGHRTLKRRYNNTERPSLAGVIPDRSIYRDKKYIPVGLVEFGRGCPFHCEFCAIQTVFSQTRTLRPGHEVIHEIKTLPKKNAMIFFVDDNFTIDVAATRQFLQKLIPMKIRWVCQASIHTAFDGELLGLMKQSGCECVLIGFESLIAGNLNKMRKPFNGMNGGSQKALQQFRKYGIPVYGTFLFGYEGDNLKTFKETVRFAEENALFIAAFNHVTPFPGTSLYNRLESAGRLLYDKWWLDDNYRYGMIPFKPEGMSATELREACFQARRKFYRSGSIVRRSFSSSNSRSWFRIKSYWLANIMHARDIVQREYHPLGDERWQGTLLEV